MAVSSEDVLSKIKEGEYAPVYFLQGEEPFFIDEIASFLEINVLEESQKAFNLIVLYGKEVAMNEVLLNARRFPMMSDRQVVIVKEAQEITDFKTKTSQQLLEQYIQNPQPSTILVFCFKYKRVDGRSSFAGKLKKYTVFLDTHKIYDNQVASWIEKYISRKGLKIDPDAAQIMADHNGNNLLGIANELEKIKNNLNDNNRITTQIVHRYGGINKDYNVFELTKAIMLRDILRVNRIVNYFDANTRTNPIIPMIALIFNLFAKLLIFHSASDKSDKALIASLSINPYFLKEYKIGAGNYTLAKVVEILRLIEEADLQSKGVDRGSISDGQILRDLTFKIMH